MSRTILRMVIASFLTGSALPGLAAKLESSTPIPPELFANQGESITLISQDEHPADPAPAGTRDPQAKILSVAVSREGLAPEIFWAAIDRRAPGTGFDVLRIDTRHTGSFKDAEMLALKPATDGSKDQLDISGIIRVKVDAKEIPCLASGMIQGKIDPMNKEAGDDELFVVLSILPFASTKLEVNGKAYRVAVADGTGDGDLADAAILARKNFPGQPEGKKAGDLFAIDLDGNGFKGRVLKGILGVPFCLDGQWLALKTNAPGTELTAEPLPNPGTGTLELPATVRLEAQLSGGGSLFPIVNGQPPIPLKAGTYRLIAGRLLGPGKTACEFKPGDSKAIFEINDGAKTGFPVPRQIQLSVTAESEAIGPVRLVSFSLEMKSDTSILIGENTGADGQPQAPTLKILDAQGKIVHTGKFEFG
jgi:hypothetical protein